MCHLTSEDKVIIPECGNCHDAVNIHLLSKIGVSATAPACTVCHGTPPEKTEKVTPTVVETQIDEGPAEVEATPAGKKIPGFEGVFAVAALVIAMYWRRRNE